MRDEHAAAPSSLEELVQAILVDCYCAIVPRADAERLTASAHDEFFKRVKIRLEQDILPLDAINAELISTEIELKAFGPTLLERMGIDR